MKQLLPALSGLDIVWITAPQRIPPGKSHPIPNIGKNPGRLIFATLRIFLALSEDKPDVVISTGAEIAIPAALWAKLMRVRFVFVESLCRVSRLSATGLLLLGLCDLFLVQWVELSMKYGGRAVYWGRVI